MYSHEIPLSGPVESRESCPPHKTSRHHNTKDISRNYSTPLRNPRRAPETLAFVKVMTFAPYAS